MPLMWSQFGNFPSGKSWVLGFEEKLVSSQCSRGATSPRILPTCSTSKFERWSLDFLSNWYWWTRVTVANVHHNTTVYTWMMSWFRFPSLHLVYFSYGHWMVLLYAVNGCGKWTITMAISLKSNSMPISHKYSNINVWSFASSETLSTRCTVAGGLTGVNQGGKCIPAKCW